MTTVSTTRPRAATGAQTTAARWLVTFAGFPLGGLAARLLVGPADDVTAAVLGGAVTGVVLGAVQAWALRLDRTDAVRWAALTGAGFAAGLAAGASVVGFGTTMGDLVVQGAVTGLLVGLAQAALLVRRAGRAAFAWPAALAATWALGWAVTTAIGVDVEVHYTVFGSSGAATVTLLTAVLVALFGSRVASAS